ncbi:MAG: hypothetical protein R2713_09795 [Ilumatobacteraceae bacterium]
MPKSLSDAVKSSGAQTIDTSPPSKAKDCTAWIEQQFAADGLRSTQALGRRGDLDGEDAGRLQGVIDTLGSTYGTGHKLRPDDVRPFLGEAGGVPPLGPHDAIDRGDTTRSLDLLHRDDRRGRAASAGDGDPARPLRQAAEARRR